MLASECAGWAAVVLSSTEAPAEPFGDHVRVTARTAADVDSAVSLLAEVAATDGDLRLLVVNSADRAIAGELDVDQLERDVLGSLALVELAAELMAAEGGGAVVHLQRDLSPMDAVAAAITGASPDLVAQLRPVRLNTIEIDGELLDALDRSGPASPGQVAAIVNGYEEALSSVGDLCRFFAEAPRVTGTTVAIRRPEFFHELG